MSPGDYIRSKGSDAARRHAGLMASRPSPTNVTDGRDWGDDFWNVIGSLPVEANSAETAARVSAVNYCVSIIAEAWGSLPLDFVDRGGIVQDVPLAYVLGYQPNHLQTGAEFWASMAFAAALRNEAFAEPVATFDGIEVWPLDPRSTTVEWKQRSMTVTHADDDGRVRRLMPQQLFWFTGLSDATARPLTPWRMAKGSIDFQLALEVGARSYFRNHQRPAGIISTEQKLSEEAFARIKEGVQRWKQGGTPIFEQGLKYAGVSSTNHDAQLVELIKQRTLEMARYWRIPRSMVGEDSAGKTSSEQERDDFVRYVMRPWTRRGEQAITARLLPPDMVQAGVRAKFNLDAFLRGDSATQWKNAVMARTASVMSTNELRTGWFGLPRIDEDWADDPRTPLNSNRAADTLSGGETAPQDQNMGTQK